MLDYYRLRICMRPRFVFDLLMLLQFCLQSLTSSGNSEGTVTPPRESSLLLPHSLHPTPRVTCHPLTGPTKQTKTITCSTFTSTLTHCHPTTLKQKHLPPIHPSFSFHSQLSSTHQQPPTNHTNQTKSTHTPTQEQLQEWPQPGPLSKTAPSSSP